MKTRRNRTPIFFSWVRQYAKVLLLFLIFAGIFAMLSALYQLPPAATGYAALLCGAVGAVVCSFSFLRFCRRHQAMIKIRRDLCNGMDDLPPARNLTEADYQDLLLALQQEMTQLISRSDRSRTEMTDYYTLWAHQIKTPIAAMRLLLQSSASQEAEALQAELFRIEQYVEMVLSYLRLDSESNDLVLQDCDLDAIIRRAARKYARLFIGKKIALDFRETGLSVLTDEKWLLFVLEQLLSNAVKYTQEGGRVEIYMAGASLIVADNGIGIVAEDLPRVMEKGFTGFNGRADRKSTGLGLYLCRRTMRLLAHGISIESEPGKGTRVTLDLARRKTPDYD